MSTLPWIKVSERLPEMNQPVIYYFHRTGISVGRYYGREDGLPVFGGRAGFLGGDVTHWLPATEPED